VVGRIADRVADDLVSREGALRDLDGQDAAAAGHAGHVRRVVHRRRGDARTPRAVAIGPDRARVVVVVVEIVPAGRDQQVGMTGVDAVINDRDDDVGIALNNLPCRLPVHVGVGGPAVLTPVVQSLLRAEQRVVGSCGETQLAREVRLRPRNPRPRAHLDRCRERIALGIRLQPDHVHVEVVRPGPAIDDGARRREARRKGFGRGAFLETDQNLVCGDHARRAIRRDKHRIGPRNPCRAFERLGKRVRGHRGRLPLLADRRIAHDVDAAGRD